MAAISITAISDPVCPFCYVGLRRLDQALHLYRKTVPGAKTIPVHISWHAYQLDPSAPRRVSQPWSTKAALRRGEDRVPGLKDKLQSVGSREGVNFSFDCKIGNTIEAHRLVVLARKLDPTKENGLEHKVTQETMNMFFEQGGDITSTEDLVRAATRAGIDTDQARNWLEGDDGLEEVQREVDETVRMGIKGVPRFVINDEFVIEGADDVGVFFEQLVLAKESLENTQKE